MSIILGIDPGSRVTGYGVIRQNGRHLEYLGSGAIRTQVEDLPTRLKRIYAGVTEIITQFQPDMFAIEQVFMAKNADSALKLGQARGTAIASSAELSAWRNSEVEGICLLSTKKSLWRTSLNFPFNSTNKRSAVFMPTPFNILCILLARLKRQKHTKK